MSKGRRKAELILTDDERQTLKTWASRPKSTQQLAQRARIVLACADGMDNKQVAAKLSVTVQTVGKWRRRFLERRVDGLTDQERPGAPRKITDKDVEEVISKTLETKPKSATHWSTRGMAEATGMSQSSISRISRTFGLKPHRTETFKLSNDPFFIEKVRDVVGLYMNPPDRAIVLCIDEKSQIQALDRTQPLLPMQPGQTERRTHDYARHGTTSLFVALNVATGEVIGRCLRRHRHQELLKFLNEIDASVSKEPFFAEITEKRIRRGAFRSVAALEQAIKEYLEDHNRKPRPFVWTADADLILGRVKAICERTSDSGH